MDDNNNDDENNINEEENYNEIEDYNYNEEENIDTVEKGQEEILEEMFLKVKQDPEGNKVDAYLDIINLDESKEKVWSYKCYQEICLIYLQFEDHYWFPIYYKKLMDMGRTIDFKYLRPYFFRIVVLQLVIG